MKQLLLSVFLVGLVGFLVIAPKAFAEGKGKLGSIQVLFDRGLDGKTGEQANQYNQVGDYFEPYFIRLFAKTGYTVTKITSRDQFVAASDQYLLTVKTVNYNPGSKAARMWVGMGAGATTMKIHFELFGTEKEALLVKDQERGSSRDWQFLCTKLSDDALQQVKPVLAGKAASAK